MKNYLILFPLVVLALFPPIETSIPIFNSESWIWVVFIAGFLGFYLWFLKINIFIKVFASYAFLASFFSSTPYVSFTSYVPLILCIYYYVLCLKKLDFNYLRNVLIVILILNLLMLFMQDIGKDYLCNFGIPAKANLNYGTFGNVMRLSSFVIMITAFLMAYLKEDEYKVEKYMICVGIILYVIIQQIVRRDVFYLFPLVRGDVWRETIRLTYERPFWGWGIGSFKIVFHQIAQIGSFAQGEGVWLQAHNCWLQGLFETGFLGFIIIVGYIVNLFKRLKDRKLYFCIFGLGFASLNMMYHSPTREIQIAFVFMAFLAYLERKIQCQL